MVIRPCSTPKASSSTLTIGTKQLVVHEALETTLCLAGSNVSSLTPTTNVASAPVLGAETITNGAPASRCSGRLVAVGEEAGGLDDDVDAEVAPRQRLGVALGEDLDRLAVDLDAVVDGLDVGVRARRMTESYFSRWAIVLDASRGRWRRRTRCRRPAAWPPEEVPADAAETVDADANRHVRCPSWRLDAALSDQIRRGAASSAWPPTGRGEPVRPAPCPNASAIPGWRAGSAERGSGVLGHAGGRRDEQDRVDGQPDARSRAGRGAGARPRRTSRGRARARSTPRASAELAEGVERQGQLARGVTERRRRAGVGRAAARPATASVQVAVHRERHRASAEPLAGVGGPTSRHAAGTTSDVSRASAAKVNTRDRPPEMLAPQDRAPHREREGRARRPGSHAR